MICKNRRGCNGKQISNYSHLPKANLVILDYRLYNKLNSRANLILLKKLGIISTESWMEYQAVIYRLLMNPAPSIIDSVHSLMSEFHVNRFAVSIHIRCAGRLADQKEKTVMVVPRQFSRIAAMVKEELQFAKSSPNHAIFISSDSSFALREIGRLLNSTTIYTNSEVIRGHSDQNQNRSIIHSSFIDLFLLTKSDVFIGVDRSGYSRVAYGLSNPKRVRWIHVWKHSRI